MSKLSKSPDRNTFLDTSGRYATEARQSSKALDEKRKKIWAKVRRDVMEMEANPEWAKDNLEYDLRSTDWILELVRGDVIYAQNLYAALCNNTWRRDDDITRKLTGEVWSCSWRHAGGIVADMREEGDYIDWYMSGMDPFGDGKDDGSVPEGVVTDRIRADIHSLGWSQVDDPR